MTEEQGRKRWARAALIIVLALFLIPLLIAGRYVAVWEIYLYYVNTVAHVAGINPYLAAAISPVLFVPLWFTVKSSFSLNRQRRRAGEAGLLAIVVLYNVALFYSTRHAYFQTDTGDPLKYYAITPEGVRIYERPGVDPKYRIPLKQITGDLVRELELLQRGEFKPIAPDGNDFFNPNDGKPQLWYYRNPAGGLEFYDKPVFHPGTGVRLIPVTQEISLEWRRQQDEIKKAADEAASQATRTAMGSLYATRTAAARPTDTPLPKIPKTMEPTVMEGRVGEPAPTIRLTQPSRQRVHHDRFTVELIGCYRRGAYVVCSGTVTNNGSGDVDEFEICTTDGGWCKPISRAFDMEGNEYRTQMTQLGISQNEGNSQISPLGPDVPVKALLTFVNVPESVNVMASVEFGFTTRPGAFVVRFRNVTLQ